MSPSPRKILTILILLLPMALGLVRPCFKYDDGSKLRCVKELTGSNGDSYGRVGIINKSQCPSIRYEKQEWSMTCGGPLRTDHSHAVLSRVFPGEVLRFGDFQTDMTQDFVQVGTCGELRILNCMCGPMRVNCADVLWAATYKRGEHMDLVRKFMKSQSASSHYFQERFFI